MKHSTETASIVESNMPKVVKKRRRIEDDSGWEEYFDYIFPDDEEGEQANLKLLQIAHQWKQNMADMSSDEDED